MELVYSKVNPEIASREEIKSEIARLEQKAKEYANEEQGIKIFINSIYGASASPYFVGYNIRVAEAITMQGQDLTKYASKILNRYFTDFWHKDKKIHKEMGIEGRVTKCNKEVIAYGDTDSVYATFEEVIASCNYPGTGTEFIIQLYELRLEEYINKCFDGYSEKYHTDNIQALELEKISESAIILAKKKYVLDLVWKDPGVFYDAQSKLNSKGVEIVQSSTPSFARKNLNELLKILFKEKKNLDLKKFIDRLKDLKEQFKISGVEEVSKSTSISDYEKGISQDKEKLVIESRCPIHVRAGGHYNYILNNNTKMKRKYQLIRSGDKVRWYFCKSDDPEGNNVFAYQPGNFPYEFAPEIDYDTQFTKVIIEPINRFIVAMGFGSIPPNLITSTRLF